ncbi:uncharacterized protein LOC117341051 [Pecten maximus]|uniref:uncharacterized protein LOC117341051 n=1 Tax=Pecten maximus TaxID=6579 RepID=UPI001458C14C|nr:uncharacterized protein LOC117341051 [Pecten maximus]
MSLYNVRVTPFISLLPERLTLQHISEKYHSTCIRLYFTHRKKMKVCRFLSLFVVSFIHQTAVMATPVPQDLTGNESQRQISSDNHHHQPQVRMSSPKAMIPRKRDIRKLDMSIPSNRAVLEIFYEWEMMHGGIGIIQSRYRRSTRSKRSSPQSRAAKRSKHHGRRRSQYQRHEDTFIRAMHQKHKGKLINLETALRRLFKKIYFSKRGFGKSWLRYG